MKKAKNLIKNNIKLLIGLIIGIIISAGGVYAAIVIQGTSVGYTDNYSLGATTVQAAIDKLADIRSWNNFVVAYTYNASTCVTGEESTCVRTTCYKTKSANSCPAGTIIKYKVNTQEIQTFHVMYDDASTITMQAQKNTVYRTPWMSKEDYSYKTNSINSRSQTTYGPLTAINTLERATAGWSNVNDITYTAGTTVFKTNKWTACSAYNTCSSNQYTLSSRTAKARMITLQELYSYGCTTTEGSCPTWLTNFLSAKTASNGETNDYGIWGDKATYGTYYYWKNMCYYSMTAKDASYTWAAHNGGVVYSSRLSYEEDCGVRAVVKVSK